MVYRIVAALLFVAFTTAYTASAEPDAAERFGTIAETWDAEISPDGKTLALGCSPNGVPAICLYALDSDAKPRLISPPDGAQITGIRWASDNYLLYYVNLFEKVDVGNDLQGVTVRRLLSYDMKTGKAVMLMRNARSVFDTTRIDSILINKPNKIQMAFTFLMSDRARANSKLSNEGELRYLIYEVDLKSGKAKVKDTLQRSVADGIHDAEGTRYAEILFNEKKKTFSVDSLVNGRKTIFERSDTELWPFSYEGISADGKTLFVHFDDPERFGLYKMSLVDGAIAPFKLDGKTLGDVRLIEDPYNGQILAYNYTDDLPQRVYMEPAFEKVSADAKKALSADSVILTSWTQDRNMFVVASIKRGEPKQYYLYDYSVPSLSPVGGEAPWLDGVQLGDVTKLTYAARDGFEIPAYLTLPPGKTKADAPFPLVLMPHGGPEARDTAEYDWMAQAVASEGYAVLQPNFRGSAGYGGRFRDAGFGEFGGKMVSDVLDGAAHLVSTGVAKPGGHCTMGWSYGGYSALMSALLDPATTKCAISINGVSDPLSLVKQGKLIVAYWEQYMGDFYRTSRSDKRSMSPLDRASEFSQPILLIHGKEDTTVEYNQSKGLAKNVSTAKLVTMPGDDHGMFNTASRRKIIEESLAFLAANHPAK